MTYRVVWPFVLKLCVLSVAVTIPYQAAAGPETRAYTVAQGDPAFEDPFPPWDEGPLPGGFSADILDAVCAANEAMECEIAVRPYEDCQRADPDQFRVGLALLNGEVLGCLSWSRTNSRLLDGLVFTEPYSRSSAPGDNDSAILSIDSEVDTSKALAFGSGYATDFLCAVGAGYDYAAPQPVAGSDPQEIVDAVDSDTDAIIHVGLLGSLVLPENVSVVATTGADDDPIRCAGDTGVMTFPPGDFEHTHDFISDFNCGLSLIAQDGTYDEICSSYDGGDRSQAPFCFDASEIKAPSKSCEKLRDKSAQPR